MTKQLLTEEETRTVVEAIQRAESTTSGEIVFAVSDASAQYRLARFQGAFAGMLTATALYLALPVTHSIPLLLWIEILAFSLSYALFHYSDWRRWFIPAGEMDARVQEAALAEFYSSGLYRTREANGILIYLSCFEKRVVILGDRGINQKMRGDGWNAVRDRIIKGIHEGRARDGICEAIEICAKTLAEHFPRRRDDINELPDQVLQRRLRPDAP